MPRIQRQVVDVEFQGSEAAALELQQRVVGLCRGSLATALAAALARHDSDERWTVVERIEVDLGRVPLQELERAWLCELPRAVAQALEEREPSAQAERAPGAPAAPRALERTRLAPQQALPSAVAYFLEHGRLPWWFTLPPGRSLGQACSEFLASPELRSRSSGADLARALRASAPARARLTRQFEPETALGLLAQAEPERHALWLACAERLHAGNPPPSLRAGLERALLSVVLELPELPPRAPSALDAGLQSVLERAAQELEPRERARHAGPSAAEAADRPRVPGRALSLSAADDFEVARAGLAVANAGLVLLHPFLPRFLELLDVAREGVLLRPARAALLLHHLACGARSAEEHELVLAKLLCGLPLESVLEREDALSEAEAAEARALLEAVLRHWEALRSTTVDGLRGNFLARAGRLEPAQAEWVLHVEAQSFDFLLEGLPWGIAHLKLPWMTRLLRVEWPR